MKNYKVVLWVIAVVLCGAPVAAQLSAAAPKKCLSEGLETLPVLYRPAEPVRWQLMKMNGRAVENSRAFVEFDFADNKFAGNAGCNRMFGTVTRNGGTIKFSQIGTTKMLCPVDRTRTENDFIAALKRATRIRENENSVKLYAGKRLILELESGANAATVKLEDKKWILKAIGTEAVPQTGAFLSFDAKKKSAGGNSGCNAFGGSYTADAAKISITEIISTKIFCEDERGALEKNLFTALGKVNQYKIENGKLKLLAGENLLLTFDAARKTP